MKRILTFAAFMLLATFATNAWAGTRPAPKSAQYSFAYEILPMNWKFFVALGRCEQPGKGKWGIDWTNSGPTYRGGLGVFAPLWSEDGISGEYMAPTADKATPIQQMIHAQMIVDRYGEYAWGCAGVAHAAAPFYD